MFRKKSKIKPVILSDELLFLESFTFKEGGKKGEKNTEKKHPRRAEISLVADHVLVMSLVWFRTSSGW